MRYGYHLLKGDQLLHFASSNRYLVRHMHKRHLREGWRGRRWAVGTAKSKRGGL